MSGIQDRLARHADVAIVLAVLGVLLVLFIPIPSPLLDFLVLANFSFALLVLLLTFVVSRPVEFSTFPSLLLVATLFRLALNVAATRLILADADAGRVIAAIGSYVVGGYAIVGLVVFFILVVVQFVVVTNGAQRVSEVAARFALDSMPGQQMSIDADLNMGFIDQSEAQRRRRGLEREAGFYGAMDGASKFVKGDAVAGIVILLINIVGGLVIGVMQHQLPWAQALQTYTLLTVGDGIVTQVPALVIAVGTGIIVTRSANDGNLGREALRQITAFPKAQLLVAAALGGLLLLPGIPAWPALALAMAAVGVAWAAARLRATPAAAAVDSGADHSMASDATDADLAIEPIEVRVGARWAAAVAGDGSLFQARIGAFRQQHARDSGFVLPRVRFRAEPGLAPDAYEIHLDGALAARGQARQDRLLAIHPGGDQRSVAGEPTRDPTYGLPALWIEPSQRGAASDARYTLVDAESVFLTQLTEVLRRESALLLTRSETDRIVARVRQANPSLVEECIPTVLSLGDVQKILQNLLREKVSIRHVEAILETLADAGRATKDPARLTEVVRQRLAAAICQGLTGNTGALHVLTIDPALESRLLQSVTAADLGAAPALEPRLLERFLANLGQQANRMMQSNLLPVLLCAPELRRHLRSLSERGVPHLRVLSMVEVPQAVELKAFGTVAAT
ncbi:MULTISPECIES: flagellar biosynthesis protein FlhA [Ramlibacter]|uniref:Flagellar type III secretion system protein FlhA n=1 Tax=Ramlibacter pinisoli TaxID=2682844 RepID=A0A6N8ISF0_9BURK|nr:MULTISPECIES: flagellar biosynthesis protein FlhA [Ramlibacter]MBA2964793.1 FHIPEP family type III secretion protein [Ramlibacter sp. CGMCC 1.13660]MVQ29758.1 flagellar type III secretion system protein FlhA [Ramlibacter pinisoli]